MNIIDFSATKRREPPKHHAALPNSVRAIIIGPSGSGKTQLLLNLIVMKWMKWDRLYLIAPNVDDQRCYEVLKDMNEKALKKKGENIIEFITDIDDAPSVEELDGSINNLVVYDDVRQSKKSCQDIFTR